jgi:allantoinase
MPLNSVPATTNVAALDAKKKAAKGHTIVNVGFIGGVIPGNAKDLKPLYKAGVRMFKCFMVPSGVDDFPHVTEKDLREALPVLAELDAPLLVHAELLEHMIEKPDGDPRNYANYLSTRPDSAETEAISQVIALADEYKAHVHIVHLSSSQSLPMLRAARARGVRVTVETCPHYLVFDAAGIKDGATEFKCAPPIRSATTRMAMWRALFARDIDQIVSDHSPCPPSMKSPKKGSFMEAWGGIASFQLGLPAVWSEAMGRGASLAHLAEWMSGAPARLAGVSDRKGKLAVGYDADLVIWDPLAAVNVDDIRMFQRHPKTPYAGRTLKGHIKSTWIKGVEVFHDGEIVNEKSGAFL